jgi:tRNA-dependent cyclodipeptide synthase
VLVRNLLLQAMSMNTIYDSLYRTGVSNAFTAWQNCEMCEFGISFSNPNHYGAKLYSQLDWASRNFSQCIINVSDSLYRHSIIKSGMTATQAYQDSLLLGRDWIKQHEDGLKGHKSFIQRIHSWDFWLRQPTYKDHARAVFDLYKKSPEFRETVESDVNQLLARRNIQHEEEKHERRKSQLFILEEIAVYALIGKSYPRLAKIYPAPPLSSFVYIKNLKNAGLLESFQGMEYAPVRLRRKDSALKEAA